MKSLLRPALAFLALTPFLGARLEENLPAGTYGIVKVESVEKTRKNLEAHPLALALKGDRFMEFIKPLLDKLHEGDAAVKVTEFEKHRDEFLKFFKGEALFAMVDTPETAEGHLPYDYVVLADTDADQEQLAEFFKKLGFHQPTPASGESGNAAGAAAAKSGAKPQADEDDGEDAEPISSTGRRPRLVAPEVFSTDDTHSGVKLHLLQVKVEEKPLTVAGWAIVDKTFIYTTAPNVLNQLVDARKSGRKDNYTDQAVYKANREADGDADAWVLLDMPRIAGAVRELSVKNTTLPDGSVTAGMMGMDPVKSYDSLGLDAIRHIRVALTLKPDDTHADSSIAWSEKRGLLKMIAVPPGAEPDLAVIPSGLTVANASRFDIGTALTEIETLAKGAFPMAAPMFDLQLGKMKNEQGLDIRGAILANFGDEIWQFASMAKDGEISAENLQDQVFVVALKDENKLNSFVETVAGKAAEQTGNGAGTLFDERELLGVNIRTVKNLPPTMPRIQYAVTKGRLFVSVGNGKLLDGTLAQFNDPKGGLATEPAFKEGLAKLPKGGSSVTYMDLGEYTTGIGRAFIAGFNKSGGGNSDAPKLDADKLPKASDLPFVVVGNSVTGENEITSRSILVRKTDVSR